MSTQPERREAPSGLYDPFSSIQPRQQPAPIPKPRGVTLRALAVSIPLVIVNCFWVIQVEGIWHTNHMTAMSLFWNTVFFLFLLVVFNLTVLKPLSQRWTFARNWPFNQGELITIYVIMTIATALAGHDSLQLGIPGVGGFPIWYQSQQSSLGWDKFNHYYPDWLIVKDLDILRVYHEGLGTHLLYTRYHFFTWAVPVLWWCAFIVALGTVMICLNVFIRKQWMENEKLSYPIVQLPMALSENGGTLSFFRNKPFWMGFVAGAGLNIYNGFALLYPAIPLIPVRHDYPPYNLGQFFPTYPWNAIGWMPMPLYPFIIALGYFLPLDLSFSLWFFYLFTKMMLVFTAAAGIEQVGQHTFPYQTHQSFGAWFMIFFMAIYTARGHLKLVWQKIAYNRGPLDDSQEPMRYRTAFLAFLAASGFLIYFCLKSGMSLGVVLVFFGIFYILSVGITRIRAELGPPAHEMAGNMNAPFLMSLFAGTTGVGIQNLTMMTMFWWFQGRGYRTHPMPCQLEAFKMSQQGGVNMKGMGAAMIFAMLIGGLFSFWAAIHLQYNAGANVMTAHNWGQYQWLKAQIDNPQQVHKNLGGIYAVGFGAIAAYSMMWMRMKFLWWPFHPAGYAISLTFGAEYYWSCLLISSIIKFMVLRYGGYKLNRAVMPFMFGLILGEYIIGAGWSFLSILLNSGRVINFRTYDFAPG
jgi:hypothetical protein